jgi:hypothetical protein
LPLGSTRRRRYLSRPAFCIALVCAVVSYGVVLGQTRRDWETAFRQVAATQRLATEAYAIANVQFDRPTGSALLGGKRRLPARLNYHFAALPSLGTTTGQSIVIEADRPLFYCPNGFLRFSLDTAAVGSIRPRTRDVSADGSYADDDGLRTQTFLSPESTEGYRFPLPASRRCARKACVLSILGRCASWRIYRLALEAEESLHEGGISR